MQVHREEALRGQEPPRLLPDREQLHLGLLPRKGPESGPVLQPGRSGGGSHQLREVDLVRPAEEAEDSGEPHKSDLS